MKILNCKKYLFSFISTILVILITLFIFNIVSIVESVEMFFSNQITSIVIVFILYFIIILLLNKVYNDGILQNSYRKISISNFFKYDKKYITLTLFLLFISILYCCLSYKVLQMIIPKINESNLKKSIIFFLGAMTYSPIIEEIIFRGIFFNLASQWVDMNDKLVKYMVIIINIIMFMSIHYIGYSFLEYNFMLSLLIAIIPRLFISVSLTYLYIRTNDIKYNIILHIIYNCFMIL